MVVDILSKAGFISVQWIIRDSTMWFLAPANFIERVTVTENLDKNAFSVQKRKPKLKNPIVSIYKKKHQHFHVFLLLENLNLCMICVT